MRTTLIVLGTAAVATSLSLFGCTGSESMSGIEVGGSGGSAGVTTLLPTGHIRVVIPMDGTTTTAPQGGEGGATSTAQGGAGGETTTAEGGSTSAGGSGGATQTITITQETTTTSSDTPTTTSIGNAVAGHEDATPPFGEAPFPTGDTETPRTAPAGNPATEPAPGGVEDACPGLGADLAPESAVSFSSRLKGMNDNFRERCSGLPTHLSGPDVVYQIVVREELTVGVDLIAEGFYPVLSIRHHNCESERVDDLCLFTQDVATRAEIALGPGAYWFVVDSGDGRMGDYWLSLKAAKATCGDGVVNPTTEECDVGPGQPNDVCFDPGEEFECMYGAATDPAGLGAFPTP